MPKARVWNDNDYPHTEKFKGETISIAAHAYIEMDYDDAKQFEGQYTPIITDGEKNPLPQFKKKIRIENLADGSQSTPAPLVCHATGQKAESADELRKLNAMHVDMLSDEDREKAEEAEALRQENEALKAQLAALQSQEKRKPGRPRKEA
jgi:hypothetical protein